MDRPGVIPTTSDSQIVETRAVSTEAIGNFREEIDKRRFRVLFAIGLGCALLVSELPYVLTLARTGWMPFPPVVDYSADHMLYLNLTVVRQSSPGEVLNPWYGDRVPIAEIPHLKFPVTFRLFALLRDVIRSWTATMLVWAGIWSLLTFAAAVFCLRSIAPELDAYYALVFGIALMVLRSPLAYMSAFAHLPAWRPLLDLTLPYERFAFPQVALPAFLAYCGLLANALRQPRWGTLVGMALLQFYCCAAFPYIVPIMALATLVAVIMSLFPRNEHSISVFHAAAFGILCAVLDGSYFLAAGLHHSGNVKMALEFQPALIVPSFRPYVALLFAVAVLGAVSRISFAGKTVVVSAAVASGILSFVNVFLGKGSQMLSHFNYLNALPTWLAVFAFGWPFLARSSRRVAQVIIATLIVFSGWEVYATYAINLRGNELQRGAIYEVQRLGLTSNDAVLATADDIASLSPLITPAKVVYAAAAQGLLTPDLVQSEQSLRQVFYLLMKGYSVQALSTLTDSSSAVALPGEVISYAEVDYLQSSAPADRTLGRYQVRQRLLPALARLESDPQIGQFLFFGAKRVVVIDDDRKPNFLRSALAEWIDIADERHSNGIRIITGRPKAARAVEKTHHD